MTIEIMVMSFPRPFIKSAQVRVVDHPQPPGLNQKFEIAVHRRLVERFHCFPADLQDFTHPKRSIFQQKNLPNCISLYGLSWHFQPPLKDTNNPLLPLLQVILQ
jgi:hypothetical protein